MTHRRYKNRLPPVVMLPKTIVDGNILAYLYFDEPADYEMYQVHRCHGPAHCSMSDTSVDLLIGQLCVANWDPFSSFSK